MSGLVGLEPTVGAIEERRVEGGFDFLQCLAGAWLRERDLLRGLEQRAVVAERNQKPQLLQVQSGDDGIERGDHGLEEKLYPY